MSRTGPKNFFCEKDTPRGIFVCRIELSSPFFDLIPFLWWKWVSKRKQAVSSFCVQKHKTPAIWLSIDASPRDESNGVYNNYSNSNWAEIPAKNSFFPNFAPGFLQVLPFFSKIFYPFPQKKNLCWILHTFLHRIGYCLFRLLLWHWTKFFHLFTKIQKISICIYGHVCHFMCIETPTTGDGDINRCVSKRRIEWAVTQLL